MKLSDSQKKLIILLNHHVKKINKDAHDENFWKELALNFPQFVEESIAYRAILETSLDDMSNRLLVASGQSWATSLSGLKYFVELFDNDPSYTFIYVSAQIKGFNLGKFAHYLNSNDCELTLSNHALFENEIICQEFIHQISKPTILSLEDLSQMISKESS